MASLRFNRAFVLALVLALLTAAGGFWWMCARNETIAFLPARAGAEWIIFPRQAEAIPHDAVSITVAFRHSFTLTTQPANAALTVCAFKGAAVAINGREVTNAPCTRRNWKLPSSAEVAGVLRPGTNVITAWVTNAVGPPALWLRLKSARLSLGTSERWQVSLDGTEWQSACRARQPPEFQPDSSLYGSTRMMDLLKSAWPVEAAFCAVSPALVWVTNCWLRRKRLQAATLPAATSTKLIYGLLAIVLIARAALFINNLPQLPRSMGFDALDHEKYIEFIQQKHALPLANNGWQMFQPPLYYLASAMVLDVCGRSVGDADAVFYLRAVNGVIGLLHCWLVLLCLRLLFWNNLQAQAAGLLVAAFLPPHLYLSQYVTNEPLAGFLVTVAIYLCLRVLRAEKEGLWVPLGIGIALGAAMLSKVSVLLALPFFPVALSQGLAVRKEHAWRDWLRSVGAVIVGCLVVCGWHYGRVWARFGKPFVVNQGDTELWHAWWQDPGFRTSAFYSRFGRVLIAPSFSAFHSFADGIYSTLWGDGLASGMADRDFLPPWNYDLMGAGYWISLGVCLLLIIGTALVLARLTRQIRAEWFLVAGMVSLFGFGLLWNTLQAPYFCSVKAFYALPALVPFSALVAVGWDWLRQRHRAFGSAVWVLLLVWSMTVYASFWIRSGSPETQFMRGAELGSALMDQGKLDEAISHLQEAIHLKPDRAAVHNNLGIALARKGQMNEAIRQFREALRFKPDDVMAHYNLGVALDQKGQIGAAISQYQEAIRLKPEYAEACYNLGNALLTKGRTGEAISQFQQAVRLKPDYANTLGAQASTLAGQGKHAEAIRFYQAALKAQPDQEGVLNNLAWLLASCPDAAFRNGPEAVRLAARACELTGYGKPLLIGTLAAAQAEAGDFPAAIATAERAATLATALRLEEVAARNRELIQLYRQGQPFHEKKGG
jgi:Flp pilus assembly protein TadD